MNYQAIEEIVSGLSVVHHSAARHALAAAYVIPDQTFVYKEGPYEYQATWARHQSSGTWMGTVRVISECSRGVYVEKEQP